MFKDIDISRGILSSYYDKLLHHLSCDILIAGAGPSGLTAGYTLAEKGFKVTILEKRLSPGGGVWGGGMMMNEVLIQEDAVPILDEVSIRRKEWEKGIFTVDSIELASGLCFHALQKGVQIFNLTHAEDVVVEDGRVTGLAVNRTQGFETKLPIDPIVMESKAVLDATGHESAVVHMVQRQGFKLRTKSGGMMGEGPMFAGEGEAFVEENTSEIFPGLFVSGMAVCNAFGGPRLGPIFGGMLLSGKKAADLIGKALAP